MKSIQAIFYFLILLLISNCNVKNAEKSKPPTELTVWSAFFYIYLDGYTMYKGSCDVKVEFIEPLIDVNGNEITELSIPDFDLKTATHGKKTITIIPTDSVDTFHNVTWVARHRGIDYIFKDTLKITPNKTNMLISKSRSISKIPDIAESKWSKSGNRIYYDIWVKNYDNENALIPIFEIKVKSSKRVEVGTYEIEAPSSIPPEGIKKFKVSTNIKYPEIVKYAEVEISKVKYEK